MKIRPVIWAMSFLLFSVALCAFQISNRQLQAQSGAQPPTQSEASARTMRRAQKFKAQRERDLKDNYQAKENNGSQRMGVSPDDLPQDVRSQAVQIAAEYKDKIYPALKKYIADKGMLPSDMPTALPQLQKFIKGERFTPEGWKPYGPGEWMIGIRHRMDGSLIIRDVYSKNPPDEPHDVWASNHKFLNHAGFMSGFEVTGWDDGKVTFDRVEENYFSPSGSVAVSGQAGILRSATHRLSRYKRNLGWQPKPKEASKDAKSEDGKTDTVKPQHSDEEKS